MAKTEWIIEEGGRSVWELGAEKGVWT